MITLFHRNEAVQYIHRLYLTADHYLGICLNLKYFFINIAILLIGGDVCCIDLQCWTLYVMQYVAATMYAVQV